MTNQRTIIAATCLLWTLPCVAQESVDRTASWFAAHPREMNAQISACKDDPGHGRHLANCWNASQGQSLRDASEAERQYNAMNVQQQKQQQQFWAANPQALLVKLKTCNAIARADIRANFDCPAAFAAAQQMTARH